MATVFVCIRTYTGDVINSPVDMPVGVWCSVRVSFISRSSRPLVARYLEIKLKNEQIASNECVYYIYAVIHHFR